MITVNFEAVTGAGLRSRVIWPALQVGIKPYLLVSTHSSCLDVNWPDAEGKCKVTVRKLQAMHQRGEIPLNTLIVVEEILPAAWPKLDQLLLQLPNEIWTINRPDGTSLLHPYQQNIISREQRVHVFMPEC